MNYITTKHNESIIIILFDTIITAARLRITTSFCGFAKRVIGGEGGMGV